jgi:hypothetical protein
VKRTVKLPSAQGVGAGQQATLRLPIGWTYEQVLIGYTGVTLAQITGIRVVGNGQTFQDYRGAERLDTINKYHGRAAANGVLVLDFTRFGLRTRGGEEMTGIGTGVPSKDGSVELSTLSVEIDIAAAAAAPALDCYAVQSAPQPLGLVKHVREFGYSAPASGEYEISDIPKGHLFSTVHFLSGSVDKLKIERDNRIAFERTDAINRLIQADGVRVPQTNVFTFDPTEIGNGGEMLKTAGVFDLRFRLEMGAAASVPVIVESIAPLV